MAEEILCDYTKVGRCNNFAPYFESRAVTGMLALSTPLIHRDWSVINIPDVCQMDTK